MSIFSCVYFDISDFISIFWYFKKPESFINAPFVTLEILSDNYNNNYNNIHPGVELDSKSRAERKNLQKLAIANPSSEYTQKCSSSSLRYLLFVLGGYPVFLSKGVCFLRSSTGQ